MDQLGEWRPHIEISRGANAQAEVHIVECNGQALVEAVDLIEHLLAHQQAGSGHRADVLYRAKPAEIARIIRACETVPVSRDTTQTDHDARVLNAPVGIEQLRPDTADLRAHRQRGHFGKPVLIRDFDVVVDEAEDLSGRRTCGGIVEAREIERLHDRHDPDRGIRRQLGEQALGLRLGRPVIDDDDFVIVIARPRADRADTGCKHIGVIARRNDQRDARRGCGQIPLRPMLKDGRLRLRRTMNQDLRDVHDPPRFNRLRQAEQEVVLRLRSFRSPPAERTQSLTTH